MKEAVLKAKTKIGMEAFNEKIQKKFAEMCKTGKLFKVAMTGQEVWDTYLKSFAKENDPIFRDPASTEHNCNHCNNFIRRYGNVVSIDAEYNIQTIFDVTCDEEYQQTALVLTAAIKSSVVEEVFFETFDMLNFLPYESCHKSNALFKLGTDKNHKRYTKEEAEKYKTGEKHDQYIVTPDEVRTFSHMHLFLPKEFVDMSGSSVETIMANFREPKAVFQRGMETISLDTFITVKDLIKQGSLRDGETHLFKIEQMVPLKTEYDKLDASKRDNWCWVKSYKLPFAKFRNELMGALCSELSEGKDINSAGFNAVKYGHGFDFILTNIGV